MKLWVDDIRKEPDCWIRAMTVTEAIRILDTVFIDEVSLDHDISMKVSVGHGDSRPFASPETFEPVARFIAAYFDESPDPLKVTIHTANGTAANVMKDILKRFNPVVTLSQPCNRFEEDAV